MIVDFGARRQDEDFLNGKFGTLHVLKCLNQFLQQ